MVGKKISRGKLIFQHFCLVASVVGLPGGCGMTCKLVDQVTNSSKCSGGGQNWKTLYRHHSDDLSSLEDLNELFLLPNQILRQIL